MTQNPLCVYTHKSSYYECKVCNRRFDYINGIMLHMHSGICFRNIKDKDNELYYQSLERIYIKSDTQRYINIYFLLIIITLIYFAYFYI